MRTVRSIRRSDHPSRPSARTCCFFSSLKTLLMPTEPTRAPVGVNVPGFPMAGFQLTLHGRIWVTPEVPGPGVTRSGVMGRGGPSGREEKNQARGRSREAKRQMARPARRRTPTTKQFKPHKKQADPRPCLFGRAWRTSGRKCSHQHFLPRDDFPSPSVPSSTGSSLRRRIPCSNDSRI